MRVVDLFFAETFYYFLDEEKFDFPARMDIQRCQRRRTRPATSWYIIYICAGNWDFSLRRAALTLGMFHIVLLSHRFADICFVSLRFRFFTFFYYLLSLPPSLPPSERRCFSLLAARALPLPRRRMYTYYSKVMIDCLGTIFQASIVWWYSIVSCCKLLKYVDADCTATTVLGARPKRLKSSDLLGTLSSAIDYIVSSTAFGAIDRCVIIL